MESFGQRIRYERQRRGISLEDISKSTKIRIHYLHALETEHFDELPGGIIGKGFVRAYAEFTGINEQDTIAAYLVARAEATDSQVTLSKPESYLQRYDQALRLPWWALAAMFVVVGFSFANVEQQLRLNIEWPREFSAKSAPPPNETAQSSSMTSPTSTVTTRPQVETYVSTGSSSKPLTNRLEPKSHPPLSSATWLPATSQSGIGTFTLLINVREDAWVSIIADGRRVLSQTLMPPAQKLVKARSQIMVRAGNIGAVDFSFNGERLPIQGRYHQARTLSFDANGLQSRLSLIQEDNPK